MTLRAGNDTGFADTDRHTCDHTAPADDTDTVIRADDYPCPYCTALNYCQLTPNHYGPHTCSQGHTW